MAKTSSTKKPANGTEKMSSGVKIIDGAQMPLDEASVRMVMEGWSIKRRMEDDKSRLDAINASLMAAHGTGCSLVVSGVCRASLAERRTLKISDYERLGSVLGERLTDLVHEKVIGHPRTNSWKWRWMQTTLCSQRSRRAYPSARAHL